MTAEPAVARARQLLAAWVEDKGGGTGTVAELRNALGNLSSPWLLVGFFAGTRCSRLWTGALLGLVATTVALIGYYLLSSLLRELEGDGFVGDLRLVLSANRGYLEGGIVTGPLFGALGAWWQSRRLHASIVAGALLMAEPLVLLLLGALGPDQVLPSDNGVPTVVRLVPGWGLSSDRGAIAAGVYAGEFVLGLGVILLAARRPLRSRRASRS